MKITRIDAFQVRWTPDEKPTQHSAFVRIHTDDGIDGIGEASPMQGGLASLGMIRNDLAPALIGKDPLDHAVLLDTCRRRCGCARKRCAASAPRPCRYLSIPPIAGN